MSVSMSLGFRAQPRTSFSLNLSFYECQGFGLSINIGTTDQNLGLPEWLVYCSVLTISEDSDLPQRQYFWPTAESILNRNTESECCFFIFIFF